jgi:NAD+ dependent glucose-6-phosphate dehydrogenase
VNSSRSKVLLTGSNGRLGRILQANLTDFKVVGCDREGPFSAQVAEVDITDPAALERIFMQFSPDHVVHLAANPQVDAPWDSVLHDNIAGTRNVFEAARQAGVRRVVFASSNHVTGAYEGFAPNLHLHLENEPRKLTVADPLRPDSLYGVSKVFGEALARFYCARYGLEAVCLRIGSVLADDDPTHDPRHRKTWLSHRDLVQLVRRALLASVTFGVYYGISDNKGAFWDLSNARAELGYIPEDDGSRC